MINFSNLINILSKYHVEKPFVKKITVFGWEPNTTYEYDLISSVNMYLNEDLNITESYVEEGKLNRPGHKITDLKYITIHDTGSAASTAHAIAHDKYVRRGGNCTSWHYTIGNDGLFHQIPNNEIAYHAGDGGRIFNLIDTNLKANNNNSKITISNDGFYEINGTKTIVAAPRNEANEILNNSHLNENGIKIVTGENGNWYIGDTYYSQIYNKIGNTGGNRNSIGIEACINKGSDIYLTWQRLAKLVALLLEENNLSYDSIVQHNFFSGKDCPMTIRHSNMWNHFLELVEAEYAIRTQFKNITINFESKSQYIDKNGRIISLPKEETKTTYDIVISDKDNNIFRKNFEVILPSI